MGDVYRESRYRDHDDPPSDDDRYSRTTVRRYKVKPGRDDQYETVEVDDDYRSRHSGHPRSRDDYHDYERRPERPRSSYEPPDDRHRGAYYDRDREDRDYHSRRDSGRDRIMVHDAKDSDHDDRRSRHAHHDDDLRIERRVEERYEDAHGHDVDHYRKETEYYARASPPPSPVVIRERPREPQKIIVQEAPSPPPVVIPRQNPGIMVIRDKESGREVARRDHGRGEDEYYYRHERREVGPYRGDMDRERERDREYAMARYDRYRRDQGYSSDEDDYVVRRRVVRRERSESPHHKRHVAAGALAGAGLTALINSRRDDDGDLPENRGRKIIAGSALGALGTEFARRAHSAYEERHGDGRESPDHHSHLKKGLGIAAVALAAAGAAKYYKANKIEKEEAHRGRSRRRGRSRSSGYSVSRSRSRTKSRRRSLSTVAKAALGTAATAGLVQHYRNKSKSRHGSRHGSRSRSKSRIRRAAEIGGAAAAAGVATKVWKNHKDKKERETRSRSRAGSHDRDFSDDESDYRRRRSLDRRSPSRSRSVSRARSVRRSDTGTNPELGLVEYGHGPLGPEPSSRGYESEAEERRRRRRRRRDRSISDGESDGPGRKRSKSRLRDMAAAGAAAIGIKEYKDKHDREKRERKSREPRSRDRDSERSRDRSPRARSRDRSRRRRDDDPDGYFDDRPGSPPFTSGGAYYPPYPSTPGAGPAGPGYNQYSNQSAEYPTYMPQDYTGYPPPPAPGPPPAGPPPAAGYPAPPPGPPAPGPPPGPPYGGANIPPDHVSYDTRVSRRRDAEDRVNEAHPRSPGRKPLPPPKSVSFIDPSPMSSPTMGRPNIDHLSHAETGDTPRRDRSIDNRQRWRDIPDKGSLQRGSSDPSADRPMVRRQPRNRDSRDSEGGEDVEFLPDRFDSQGRPLDAGSARQYPHGQWTTRSVEFERRPRRPGDWDVRGAWQVGGTDPEAVERIVRGVTGALDGRGGLIGVLGSVLNSGLLGGPEARPRTSG